MKLHRSTTEAVLDALHLIFAERRYADKVIEKILRKDPRWGARDRRFIAETTYDIVRWYRWLQIATNAAEGDYKRLLEGWLIQHEVDIPDWFGAYLRPAEMNARAAEIQSRAVLESIPDWLDELGERELGPRWDAELKSLNEEAAVVLRANTNKVTREVLQVQLHDEEVETKTLDVAPDALEVMERQNIFHLPSFKEGLFEVQDAGSQLIAPFLRVEAGMRVIDACAGAGGKTLHLAAIMKNKGRILAMDTEEWKLEELKKRSRRAGATNIETRVIESTKTIKRLGESADRLLLDVPCSGLGVLKRNPDAKWKLSIEFIDKVKSLQQDILRQYSTMLKPGGLLVYSTCSILTSENTEQVNAFLKDNSQFELLEEKSVWPSEGFDGFYVALMRRLT